MFFFCSHWSLVDVPLIFFCPADHVPDWQPRILLGMVEARSVNVKKTTTGKILYFFKEKKRKMGRFLLRILEVDLSTNKTKNNVSPVGKRRTEEQVGLNCGTSSARTNRTTQTGERSETKGAKGSANSKTPTETKKQYDSSPRDPTYK